MAGVPFVFGNATTSIPLSNLDADFNTPVTIGNTTVGLGNTVTTLGNVTLNNVTITSGTINVSANSIVNGTSNVVIASSGGAVNISTNGTQAITVDTSQNVGIGVATPNGRLDVIGSDATAYTSTGASRTPAGYIARINNSNGTAGNLCSLDFAVQGTTPSGGQHAYIGAVAGVSYTPAIVFGQSTGAASYAEAMRINATAPVLCLAGGNTSATGTGIAFPATQSASSDANTLDDYEEGTWTPSLTGFTTVGANTAATGTYTKIGRVVYLQATITYATSMAGVGGTSYITGLPFTPGAGTGNGGFANDSNGIPINVISAYPGGVRIYFPTFGAVPGIDLGITYAV